MLRELRYWSKIKHALVIGQISVTFTRYFFGHSFTLQLGVTRTLYTESTLD